MLLFIQACSAGTANALECVYLQLLLNNLVGCVRISSNKKKMLYRQAGNKTKTLFFLSDVVLLKLPILQWVNLTTLYSENFVH
jgi:hypothetical protein